MCSRPVCLLGFAVFFGLGGTDPALVGPDVSFALDRDTLVVGERPRVRFDRPLPAVPRERYWITIVGRDEDDSAWGQWQYVDDGATEVLLKNTKLSGDYEVRLHGGYPGVPYDVVYRLPLTVESRESGPQSSGALPTFTLDRDMIGVGETPRVIFSEPLPAVPRERYWITVVEKSKDDRAWGQWQYVDDGATEILLKKPPGSGEYEVRLHDGYPGVQYNVIHRQPLLVGVVLPSTGHERYLQNHSPYRSSRSPGRAAAPSRGGMSGKIILWEGEAGDGESAFDPPGWRRPDIVAVRAEGKGGELILTLVFDRDLEQTLWQKTESGAMKGYMLAEVYFDVDNDIATGRRLGTDRTRRGYDLGLEIDTGLRITAGGATMSQWGNIESIPGQHEVTDVLINYHVAGRSEIGRKIESSFRGDSSENRISMQGHKLVIRVPYAQLGLEPNQTVRTCFLDHTMEVFKKNKVSVDAWLRLR